MMSPNEKRSRVNGFTLTEMIVVIAIIGILLGILMPSMMNYYRSSRVKAANADAKMVYNAAQTEVMRYINIDRAEPSAAAKSGFSGTTVISYDPTNGITVSKNLSNTPVAANVTAAHRTIVQNVNRTVSGADLVCWSICVNNYIVQASASAQNSSSNYVGFYSANKQSADLDDIAGDYGAGSPLPTYMTTLKNLALHY